MSYVSRLRREAVDDDAAFAEYLSDGALVFPRHLREMSAFANRSERGLILAPRGHAKTTLFQYRLARRIGVSRGRRRFGILAGVTEDADARSGAVRRLVEHPRFGEIFPWARGEVAGSPWTDSAWTVRAVDLGKDRTVTAISLGSARPGARLDELLADDAVGKQENDTASGRRKALETYLSVVDPMVVPGGRRIFLGTRWHEDDLYATLIRAGWPHLVRAALSDGLPLWPDLYSADVLDAKRHELGSAIFDLQFMNDPSGMVGNIIKRDWFRYVTELPRGARRAGVDLAASSTERSDYTAYVEWLEDADLNLYLVGAFRERLDSGHRAWLTGMTEERLNEPAVPIDGSTGPCLLWATERLPAGFVGLAEANPEMRALTALNIESTTFQSTFAREILARTRLPAQAVYPDKDKVTRARTLAARYEAGKVFHLRSAPGLDAYEREIVAFPNGEHDDLVDAAVYGAGLNATSTELYWTSARR